MSVLDPDLPGRGLPHPRLRLASVPIREHAYQAGCHQRRRRRGGSGTRGAGGGKANRSAFCRKRSHSSRVSVSCARNSSETARKVAICASRTGVGSGVAFGTTVNVSPVAGWGDRIDPVQFGGVETTGHFQATEFAQRQSGHWFNPR